jgi:hypothetical protein
MTFATKAIVAGPICFVAVEISMKQPKKPVAAPEKALRTMALRYPEAEEGVACKGTALECSAFQARKKTFMFMGRADLRLKLQQSLSEAVKLAAKEPQRFQAGSSGWVTIRFSPDQPPPLDILERWLDESYRLLIPKQQAALLPEQHQRSAGGTARKKKKAAKK